MKNKIYLVILILLSFLVCMKLSKPQFQNSQKESKNSDFLAIYVDDKISDSFPTSSEYAGTIICRNSSGTVNTTGKFVWDSSNSKWNIEVSDIDNGAATCNAYFYSLADYTLKSVPNNWMSAKQGSLLYSIKKDNDENIKTHKGKPGTEVARQASSSTEAVLASSTDDYGTTLYFRGAVTNNFVEFASMCWRIVRITGDGSIKLALYNRNDNGSLTPCSDSGGTGKAFISATATAFNSLSTATTKGAVAQYAGMMYGTTYSSSDYDIIHANNIDSTILVALKSWYDNKLRNYNDLLSDVIWCNDREYGTLNGRHQAFKNKERLIGFVPSFICAENSNSEKKLFKLTNNDIQNGNGKLKGSNGVGSKEYKIGLLTGDELAFAGAKAGNVNATGNTTFYLYSNTSATWWTMSPAHYTPANYHGVRMITVSDDGEICVSTDGNGCLASFVRDTAGVRPSIALKSTVEISNVEDADGTATHPYKIRI